jgi:hypothetical protein
MQLPIIKLLLTDGAGTSAIGWPPLGLSTHDVLSRHIPQIGMMVWKPINGRLSGCGFLPWNEGKRRKCKIKKGTPVTCQSINNSWLSILVDEGDLPCLTFCARIVRRLRQIIAADAHFLCNRI